MIIVTIRVVEVFTFVLDYKSCTLIALMLYRVKDNLYVCKKERKREREGEKGICRIYS